MGRGFVPAGTLTALAGATGGFLVPNLAIDRLSFLPVALRSGYGRIAAKAGLGIALGILARKFAGKNIAAGVLIGGLLSPALDVVNMFLAKSGGMAGLGEDMEGLGADEMEGLGEGEMDGLGADSMIEGLGESAAPQLGQGIDPGGGIEGYPQADELQGLGGYPLPDEVC